METAILRPSYYDRFSCLGSKCNYTCCQGWDIILTKNEYTHIKNLKKSKELETLTKKAFHRIKKCQTNYEYASIAYNQEHCCILLTDEKLCSLQQFCGHKVLPYACQVFPRSFTYNSVNQSNLLEQHLSLGCEAVVKIIMELSGGIDFESYADEITKVIKMNHINSSTNAEERPIYKFIWEIKTLGVDILQNRLFTIEDRLLLLGLASQYICQIEEKGQEEEILPFIQRFHAIMSDHSTIANFHEIKVDSIIKGFNAIYIFDNICTNKQYLHNIRDYIYNNLGITKSKLDSNDISKENIAIDSIKYDFAKQNLNCYLSEKEYIIENILVTYFLYNNYPFYKSNNSIWDHFLFFISIYNFLIHFLMGYLTENSTDEDFIRAVTICSREINHNISIFDSVVDHLKETQSDTLAHMAILIK